MLLILDIPVSELLTHAFFERNLKVMSLFTVLEATAIHVTIGAAIIAEHKALITLTLSMIAFHAIRTLIYAYVLNCQATTVSATA